MWHLHYYLGSNLSRCSGGWVALMLFTDVFMHIATSDVYPWSLPRNWWPRQCCGADSLLCSPLLYCNHRKQSQIHISPSFLTFSRAGKDRIWLPVSGLVCSVLLASLRQKTLTGFQVLHILSSDLKGYEAWDEEMLLLGAPTVRGLPWDLKDGSHPAGELQAAAAKSKRRLRRAPTAELLTEM